MPKKSPAKLLLLMLAGAAFGLAACEKKAAAPATPAAEIHEPDVPRADAPPIVPVRTDAPAGAYRLDKAHASLVFSVNHIGYSEYTAGFDDFDATLDFDPASPANIRVSATINPASLDIPTPPAGFLDELKSAAWLGAIEFPAMRFHSTSVTLTGPSSARIDGALEIRGVTAPVSFDAVFNGGYAGFPPYDPNARIGFSAKGVLKRSAFGMTVGIPTAEMPVGVSDDVSFRIEAEFIGPPSPEAP